MLTLFAAALLSQDLSADEVLRRIEERIEKASSVQFKVSQEIEDTITVVDPDDPKSKPREVPSSFQQKGTVAFQGRRCSLQMTSETGASGWQLVSNGQRLAVCMGGKHVRSQTTPDNLGRNLLFLTSRLDPLTKNGYLFRRQSQEPEDLFQSTTLSNLKKGLPKNGLQTLTYRLTRKGATREIFVGTIWYDPKTFTIARRVVMLAENDWVLRSTYSDWVFDQDLPEETFKIPPREY